jgi:hypothetical protein
MLENYNDPWIGVDLDGTLAEHLPEFDISKIGPPIPAMVNTVKSYLANGKKVKIFTARASLIFDLDWDEYNAQVKEPIDEWCRIHIGEALPITCSKDFYTIGIVDDIAVHAYKGDIYNAGTHLALKAQFDHLQEKYNKLESENESTIEDRKYPFKTVVTKHSIIDIKDLVAENERLIKDLDTHREIIDQQGRKIVELQEEVNSLEENEWKREKVIDDLKDDIKTHLAEIHDLEEDVRKLSEQIMENDHSVN